MNKALFPFLLEGWIVCSYKSWPLTFDVPRITANQPSLPFSLRGGQPGQSAESQGNKTVEGWRESSSQASELDSCLLGCEESGAIPRMSAICPKATLIFLPLPEHGPSWTGIMKTSSMTVSSQSPACCLNKSVLIVLSSGRKTSFFPTNLRGATTFHSSWCPVWKQRLWNW